MAARIRGKRNELGMTQKQLGEKIHVNYVTVSQWERDTGSTPTSENIFALAEVFGVTPNYLFGWDEQP